MAANFDVKFLVNRTAGTYQIQVTDTSSGFTLSKAQVKITYPDNFVENNTDWDNPDISSAGGTVNKSIRFDIDNKVLTGDYVFNFTARESNNTEHTAQKSFNLTWKEPVADISNTSDVTTPEVSFKDNTSGYDNGNFTESITTRTLTSSFPSTSAASGASAITGNNTSNFGALTIDMVNSGNYYEGDYTPSLSINITYTHTSASYLTLQYIKAYSETISIKRAPTQTELLTKINTYKENIDSYKTSNLDLYNNKLEEYDLVIGLYSHLIDRIDATLTDGSEQILRDLLGYVEPLATHTFQSAAITQFTTTETESTQDIIGGMVSSNTESGIDVTYNDTTGKINFDVADFTITQTGDTTGTVTVTNLANATLNSTLATVNSTTGAFGSTTAIPVITVNGKGLITNVTTAAISTVLTLAADSGSNDTVTIGTDTLTIAGGTGLTTTISDNNISVAIDSTVVTLTGGQTLTNKILTSPVLNTGVSGTAIKDEDDMSSNSATHLATQQSIKAYVDSQVDTVDTLSEILAIGNNTGGTKIEVNNTSGGIDFIDNAKLRLGTGDDNLEIYQDGTNSFIQVRDPLINTTAGTLYINAPIIDLGLDPDTTVAGDVRLRNVSVFTGSVIKDEDNMASNSSSHLATQQSIKAYVDSQVTAQDLDFQGDSGGALSIDLDSETLDIAGDGAGISTAGSGNQITISADHDALTNFVANEHINHTSVEIIAGNGLTGGGDISSSRTINVVGGGGITVAADSISITPGGVGSTYLANTSVTAGSYGSATAIPTFTVDADGRLTAAGTVGITTDVVGDTTPQLGGTLDTNGNLIQFGDSGSATDDRLQFGASQDLEIYHDGSDSYISDTGTGNLIVSGSARVELKSANDKYFFRGVVNSGVDLYFNDSIKLTTTTGGIDVTGTLTADALDIDGNVQLDGTFTVGVDDTGYDVKFFGATSGRYLLWDESDDSLKFTDNVRAKFGTNNDLHIYHDGNNSYVRDTNAGNLYLDTNGDFIGLISDGSFSNGKMGLFYKDGAVKLYHDNSLKIETTSAGATVTGTLTADAFSGPLTGTATGLAGTPNITVGTISSGNITTSGYLRGPASFTIDPATHGDDTGTVVIAGNLQVDGTTTTINSTTVAIDDLNFSIATDAADSAAANGAGITIGGASATLTYTHADTSWNFNKPLNVTGGITASGNTTITGDTSSPHTDNALYINRGSDGAVAFRVQNSGEVVIPSNYLWASASGTSLYVQNAAVFRGSISNDGGNVTVGDNLDVTGVLSITGDGSNAVTLTESGSGDFTIDAAGDIAIDADGGDIRFKDGSVGTFGIISNSSSDFVIHSQISDKDILFKGEDDTSTITALTLDMSAAGKATFNAEANGPAFKAVGSNTSTNVTSSSDYGLRLQNTSNTDGNFISIDFYNSTGFITGRIGAEFQDAGDRNTDLYFATRANSGSLTEAFRIDSSQNATFAGNVTVNGGQILTPSGVNLALNPNTGVVSVGGAITTTSTIAAGSTIHRGNMTIDSQEIDISSGDFTLDVAGDIVLDADGGDIVFKDNTTAIGRFKNNSGNFVIK